MKMRRVTLTFELETDASIRDMARSIIWLAGPHRWSRHIKYIKLAKVKVRKRCKS